MDRFSRTDVSGAALGRHEPPPRRPARRRPADDRRGHRARRRPRGRASATTASCSSAAPTRTAWSGSGGRTASTSCASSRCGRGSPRRASPPASTAPTSTRPATSGAGSTRRSRASARAGMKVMLTVSGPGPVWTSRSPGRGNPRYKPDPAAFADFATAVATRYGADVDRYILWNEPNLPSWLQPQASCAHRHCTPVAPHLYRGLVRAAYPAIKAADPGARGADRRDVLARAGPEGAQLDAAAAACSCARWAASRPASRSCARATARASSPRRRTASRSTRTAR